MGRAAKRNPVEISPGLLRGIPKKNPTVTASLASPRRHRLPKPATLWVAETEGRDFRKSLWKPKSIDVPTTDSISVTRPKPATGSQAFYLDCGYKIEDIPFTFCTQLRVNEK